MNSGSAPLLLMVGPLAGAGIGGEEEDNGKGKGRNSNTVLRTVREETWRYRASQGQVRQAEID